MRNIKARLTLRKLCGRHCRGRHPTPPGPARPSVLFISRRSFQKRCCIHVHLFLAHSAMGSLALRALVRERTELGRARIRRGAACRCSAGRGMEWTRGARSLKRTHLLDEGARFTALGLHPRPRSSRHALFSATAAAYVRGVERARAAAEVWSRASSHCGWCRSRGAPFIAPTHVGAQVLWSDTRCRRRNTGSFVRLDIHNRGGLRVARARGGAARSHEHEHRRRGSAVRSHVSVRMGRDVDDGHEYCVSLARSGYGVGQC
ncbi:hypothetical protein DFH09DRAFT_1394611 [Mycena vulgaris]|nr:hypothetical protein DFH09DRAFT_1394611 [Mycena vulgaris]